MESTELIRDALSGTRYASSRPLMTLSLKPEHLKRYKDIARLLIQHGRSDLVKAVDLELPAGEIPQEVAGDPERLARDLEALGPTFIKLGQLLSTRSDLLPATYLEALTRLQDQVEPFPFADVEEIVSSELGVRLSKAFLNFDARPRRRLPWARCIGRSCATAGRWR
jgi:ubiquinone biosynthesis protein